MIIRYTTPYHNFVLPFRVDEIDDLDITYTQNGKEITHLGKNDVEIIDVSELIKNASMGQEYINEIIKNSDELDYSSVLKVHLTQEQTSLFTFYRAEEKNIALVQIRVRNIKNDSFNSRPIKIRVYGSISEGVL